MEGRLHILVGITLTLCLTTWVTAEPATSYTTTSLSTKSDSYWTTGNEVAVYLIIIPLLLIPLIMIGLKIAERGGEYGNANGHYDHHHKRAFSAESYALLNHLTRKVLDAIKE